MFLSHNKNELWAFESCKYWFLSFSELQNLNLNIVDWTLSFRRNANSKLNFQSFKLEKDQIPNSIDFSEWVFSIKKLQN